MDSDKVIWKFHKKLNPLNVIWSYGIIIGLLSFGFVMILLPFKYGWDIKSFIVFVAGVISVGAFFLSEIYPTFNMKAIYATKDNLVIKRFLNKDIKIPLGSFYIRLYGEPSSYTLDSIGFFEHIRIIDFENEKVLYNFILPANNPLRATNFDTLDVIIAPKVEIYLANLDKEIYERYKKELTHYFKNIGSSIDFHKINKLRKEQKQ